MPETNTTVGVVDGAAVKRGGAKTVPNKNAEGGLLQRLKSMTLKSKLLMMLLPTSLLSMATVAFIGYNSGKTALTQKANEQLVAMRAAKKQQVETYFSRLRDVFGVFGEDVAVVSAMSSFRDGFNQLGRVRISDERRRKLEDYYNKQLLPELNKRSTSQPIMLENIWPRTDRGVEAQVLYLAENPNPPAERLRLLDHPVSNPYTLAHFTYHGWFRDVAQRLQLHDLMLFDVDTGAMVYSVAKELDLGTTFLDGPHANTNLGRLFRQVIAEHKKGYVKFVDFENYIPSGVMPAMFLATPVYSNFKLSGVLIGQTSIDALSNTMNGSKNWRADGMGDTGLAYIAGPSMFLRNDHRGFIENRERFAAQLRERGAVEADTRRMLDTGTSVLSVRAGVDGVRAALRGETGTMTALSIIGNRALQAYAPLNIPDLNWVLMTQVDEAEALAPQFKFQRDMMILACALALATMLAAMGLAAQFMKPINALISGIDKLKSGRTDVHIAKTSNDEFGRLSDSFNDMAETIRARDKVILDKSQAHEALLHRIFPDAVADRMKKGEAQIVESVSNVTLIYASVLGFVGVASKLPGPESSKLLNQIVAAIDALAETHGIERVRTFGEHYIAACGLSVPRLDHAQRAMSFTDALSREIKRLGAELSIDLRMRASLASGDVHAGLVGNTRFLFDVWGVPLNQCRRLVHEAATGEVRITEDTYKLLGSSGGFSAMPAVQTMTIGSLVNYGRPLANASAVVPGVTVPVARAAE